VTYVALLRGINVGGQKLIKMEVLKKIFEDMGFKNARTYIQSGNVIFDAGKSKPETLRQKIETWLEKILGYGVTVVVRTMDELEQVIKKYPFSKVKGHENSKVYVSFLSEEPDKNRIKELTSLSSNNEMFHIKGNNVYILLRMGFPDSLTGKNIIEKKLKVRATTRNWQTVNKLQALSAANGFQ
jgi:uncharacterized protein (DUF1697 family)